MKIKIMSYQIDETEDYKQLVLMFYHVFYMITRFSTVTGCRFVPWFILVLPDSLALLVVMVLSRPPGLARSLGLDPLEYHDVLGTWDNTYLKDTFDL